MGRESARDGVGGAGGAGAWSEGREEYCGCGGFARVGWKMARERKRKVAEGAGRGMGRVKCMLREWPGNDQDWDWCGT